MSVIGFDIGNESCVIACAKRGGIDVLLNDESKRETPAVVSFGEKQRFLGCAGAAFATANLKSTISQVKRLIGRLYNEPSVQEDLKLLPFATSEGPRGGVLIELEYLKRKWTFMPVEILGMLFIHLKQITEKNLESPVTDCVIGIPSYFTDLQRREYLDAASIAGLRPMMLMHDCTAIALGYGMYKTDLSNSRSTNVMFVDIGQCDTQVTVAAFKKGQMKILSHSFDQNLGGRDFDEVLFKHFAAEFQEQYKIDVYPNARACIRLRASCEKLKKVLSANADAPISIDCLIEDTDVKGFITREYFEYLSSELLERVTVACNKALKDSGLSVDKIYTIELVGSGSRIPAITRILSLFFRKEPTRTLNASECVARGCALRCAMLSPTLVVRNYEIEDLYPYSIALPLPRQDIILFPKGSPFPSDKTLGWDGNITFDFPVSYTNDTDFPAGISPIIGRFMIGPSEPSDAEKRKVKFKVKLNDHGIFEIDSAWILEDKRYSARIVYSFLERNMSDSHLLNLPFSENLHVATTKDELRDAKEREKMLAEQDMKVEQTKDQRNTLEAFVYDTRSKLSSAYRSFATDAEEEGLTKSLQETEDWLYEDSDDESEQDYTGKLQDLKKLLEPIENRYKEENARTKAVKALQTCIAKYRSLADSLPADQKEEVKDLCNRAEHWLNGISQQHSSPKGSSSYINEAIDAFESGCRSMMRPKPSYPRHEPVDSNERDQRSTLELFIHDARSKLSSAYQSFTKDSEKEVVTSILKETEDWLCKESEQDYTGKLEYLKKLLEPIENRYKEENARAKAVKAFQTCIVKYRSFAHSLPAGKKKEVKNECNKAEMWLNRIVQQHSSPKNSSSYINQVIIRFESNCEYKMRPFQMYDESAVSVQMDQPVVSDQMEEPVDSNLADQRVVSNESDQHMDSNTRDQPVDSNTRDQPVDSNKRDQPLDSNKRDQPEKSNKGDQMEEPVDSNQADQPVDSNKSDQHMDSNTRHQPVDLNKRDQPLYSNKEENARAKAAKALQIYIAEYRSNADSLPSGQKEEVKILCNEAEQWLNNISQQHSSPESLSTNINQAIKEFKREFIKSTKSVFPKYDEPEYSDQMDQPEDMNQKVQLMDPNKSDQLMDRNQSNQLLNLNQSDKAMDSKQSDQPVDANETDQSADSNKRDPTLGLEQKGPTRRLEQEAPTCEVKQKGPTCEVKKKGPIHGLEPKSSSSCINEGIEAFESGCRSMTRPKPSCPRHEPVDSIKRDQRSTLELFIHDARSKVSSAYQSFATDSEKEVITNILKETEDWLYNESEQVYTRKLEYLKKVSRKCILFSC